MNPSIKIEDLNHFYGEKELTKQVLFDINLEIKAGEIVILTGPSGSGKTTLLSLIGALRSVQNGSLQELNQELYGASEEQLVQIRRHIGYIFQAHNLLPFLTARENVQMSIELHENISKKQAIAKSEAILKEVGLGERINYYPDNLSGGQKQRVAIARALVSHPSIVLADEPTAALDKKTGRDVVNLMQILAKEQHCTILLVTHDDRILDIADRVIHMEDGRLNTATNLLTTNSKKEIPDLFTSQI
jgi:putative ABC transport system ATP-binding protein